MAIARLQLYLLAILSVVVSACVCVCACVVYNKVGRCETTLHTRLLA